MTERGRRPAAPDALWPQDLVITICGAHLGRGGQQVWSRAMVEILAGFGFSTEASRAALSRLVTRGLLGRVKHGRKVAYDLTDRAVELLAEGDRRIFGFGRGAPVPGTWTVLWHTVPEDRRVERHRLVTRLRFLGFGPLHEATWIAAGDHEPDVRRLLRRLGVEPYAVLLIGRLPADMAPAMLLSGAWDLAAIQRVYDGFLADYRPYADGLEPGDDAEAFAIRTRMLHRFRHFPAIDPVLPEALAPFGSLRTEVVATFDAVEALLAAAAGRHFTAMAPPVGGAPAPPAPATPAPSAPGARP